ncbi:response regulator [Paenibacillus sp. HJL G12]|uniref:Response regulator n=1 Tax=Paenibacillus dendrobii TaxID=2691084 RepID=A0A7X3IMQ3_9BACL|nr:response regulator [Paenibacillus dendrobii]MWV46126.1 response regulator [Paenibacillus dendrobii]
MWRAILIDDEEIALDVMGILLDEVGDVEVVGRFQLVTEAIEQCGTLQPDLIFLDIEMPGMGGLEAAGALAACCPDAEIVFVTAHDQYAIDAFDTSAIGYLLKPVAKDRLVKTLSRYAERQAKRQIRSVESMRGNELNAASPAAGLEGYAEDKPRLLLKVLGSMELYAPDGRLLTWRTKKTKELFALLWHHRSRPVYKYAILEYLWPDDSAERGQKLLHTSLYYLRSLFKAEGYDGFVKYGDERYWIDSSAIRSDLEELLGMLKEGDAATKAEDMIRLYSGGDYLEMEHYEWANAYRMELRSAMMSSMNAALGRVPNEFRLQLLWKLIELEPSRLPYYDLLVDCLYQAGDEDGVRRVRAMMEQMELKGE